MVKVTIAGLVGALVVFYVATSPDQAANIVHGVWHVLVGAANGIGDFFDKVAS